MLLDEKEVVEFMEDYLRKNLEMYTVVDMYPNNIRVVVSVNGLDIEKSIAIPGYRTVTAVPKSVPYGTITW